MAWMNASPSYFINKDSPPLLIIHGKFDTIVPISEARDLVESAKHYNVKHIYIELNTTHRWTLNPYGLTNQRTLPAIANFLRQETDYSAYSN